MPAAFCIVHKCVWASNSLTPPALTQPPLPPPPPASYKPFRALPLPYSTASHNAGGQVGVPKVSKRPNTTPHSPCIGLVKRRKSGMFEQPKAVKQAAVVARQQEKAVVVKQASKVVRKTVEVAKKSLVSVYKPEVAKKSVANVYKPFKARALPKPAPVVVGGSAVVAAGGEKAKASVSDLMRRARRGGG